MFASSVLRRTMSQVRVERAPCGEASSDRIAVIAQFSRQQRTSLSLNTMIAELLDSGYRVIISSSCQSPSELVFDESVRDGITVLRRPNLGYDFGSWACGLAWDPDISGAKNVVFLNDSMVGPFTPLETLLTRFEKSNADVYGLTDTSQFVYHLQSYFLGFRNGILRERPLSRFWTGVRHEVSKQETIHRNEIGFSRLLNGEGYATEVAFTYRRMVNPGENPTIRGWEKLLAVGFPFVKREIIRTPWVAPRGDEVAGVVRRKFGVDIKEWL